VDDQSAVERYGRSGVYAVSVTRVLYPDDSTQAGRALRFLQQYFMVSCSLQDIVARFARQGVD
jgi:glycogen phosphorylase